MRSSVSMRSHTMASASSMTAISRRMISFSYTKSTFCQLNILDFLLTGWYDNNGFHAIPYSWCHAIMRGGYGVFGSKR